MTEIPTYQPNKKTGLTRGEFVVGAGKGATIFGLLYLFNRYLRPPQPVPLSTLATETAIPPIDAQVPTTTPFPTEGPQLTSTPMVAEATPSPEATPTPTPENTPTPEAEKYAHYFPEGTDLRFTIGSIDWKKPVTINIGADANLYAHFTGQGEVNFTFMPIVIDQPGVWNDHLKAIQDFNNWNVRQEKAMVFPSFPSENPTVIVHSNTNEVKKGHRIFPGEFFRKAMDYVSRGLKNPLIGKNISFEQLGYQDIPHKVDMEIVHMEKLTVDDFWSSLFYLDSNNSIYVDANMAWKPDPQNPEQRLPLIPEEFRGPGHINIAHCDRDPIGNLANETKYATIVVLKLKEVSEVTNLLSALVLGLRQGLLES